MPCRRDLAPSPEQIQRVAKMASAYSLKACEEKFKADPVGVTILLSHILEGSGLKDPDFLATKLMVGKIHKRLL